MSRLTEAMHTAIRQVIVVLYAPPQSFPQGPATRRGSWARGHALGTCESIYIESCIYVQTDKSNEKLHTTGTFKYNRPQNIHARIYTEQYTHVVVVSEVTLQSKEIVRFKIFGNIV